MAVTEGKKAPAFSAMGDDEQNHSLKDFKGQKVILYFYPKDNTPGCTQESCDFRDNLKDFTNLDATIIGVSKDSVKSHQKFKEKHKLPFLLLSDPNGKLCEAYGVFKEKSMFGKTYLGIERSTFLIDEDGVVQKIWRNVKVAGHVDEVFGVLEGL